MSEHPCNLPELPEPYEDRDKKPFPVRFTEHVAWVRSLPEIGSCCFGINSLLITLVRSLGYSIFTRTFLQGSATHSKVESTRFKNQARMNSRNPHNI
ncbi:hypothetical protein HanXRQr2_Chr08g0326921 [Helianthus annuus]|uniref:Uncharacterized protein n=2 Tax=Helianthus annuus TaxID=4232 RepID=A0A251U4R5_HELAN|nr:hypothetical protein HanXRQr2_Chr08g0326921 [Helianthus annuus]KAJ0545750.1 hypothetical protein HanIR_Chr08g0353231 [Helianthus annuus]